MVRCADDNSLECFELEKRDSSIVITARMLKLDTGGGDSHPRFFACHSFTQRLPQAVPVPVIGMLAALRDGRFSLRIFGACCRDGSLEDIASDCHEVLLDFVPTLLKDTLLPPRCAGDFYGGAFMISGSNKTIRIIAMRISTGLFELLPEAAAFVSVPMFRAQVLCVDSRLVPGSGRFVTSFGCDDGTVVLSMVDKPESRVQLDGPVSSICIFSKASVPRAVGRSTRQHTWADRPLINWTPGTAPGAIDWGGLSGTADAASAALARFRNATAKVEVGEINVGCGGAAGFVVVFENVGEHGLDKQAVLTRTEDTVLSMVAGDFDCDGREELLVGTYGGQLLVFGQEEELTWKGFQRFFFFEFFDIDIVCRKKPS
jgi:hypothetical protein